MSKRIIRYIDNREIIKTKLNKSQLEFYDFLKNSFPNELFELRYETKRVIDGEEVDILLSRDNILIDDLFLVMSDSLGYTKHLIEKLNYLYDLDYLVGSIEYYLKKDALTARDIREYKSTSALFLLYLSNHNLTNLLEILVKWPHLTYQYLYLTEIENNVIKNSQQIQLILDIIKVGEHTTDAKLQLVLTQYVIKYKENSSSEITSGNDKITLIDDKVIYNSNIFSASEQQLIKLSNSISQIVWVGGRGYIKLNDVLSSSTSEINQTFYEIRNQIINTLFPQAVAGIGISEYIEINFDVQQLSITKTAQVINSNNKIDFTITFNDEFSLSSGAEGFKFNFELFSGSSMFGTPTITTVDGISSITIPDIEIEEGSFSDTLGYSLEFTEMGHKIVYDNFDSQEIIGINYTQTITTVSSGSEINKGYINIKYRFPLGFQNSINTTPTVEIEKDNILYTTETPTIIKGTVGSEYEIALSILTTLISYDASKDAEIKIKSRFTITDPTLGAEYFDINSSIDMVDKYFKNKTLPTPSHKSTTYYYTGTTQYSRGSMPASKIELNNNIAYLSSIASMSNTLYVQNTLPASQVSTSIDKTNLLINVHNEHYVKRAGHINVQYKMEPFHDSNILAIAYSLPEFIFSGSRNEIMYIDLVRETPSLVNGRFKFISKQYNLPNDTTLTKVESEAISYVYNTQTNFTSADFADDKQTYTGTDLKESFWFTEVSNTGSGAGVVYVEGIKDNAFVYINKVANNTIITINQPNMPAKEYKITTTIFSTTPVDAGIEIGNGLNGTHYYIKFSKTLIEE